MRQIYYKNTNKSKMEEQYTNAENTEMYLFPGYEKYIHILYSSFIFIQLKMYLLLNLTSMD